ncbi:hypothetical protein V8C86DRAFT_3111035 [Haematococcus lacustris]
MHIDGAIEAQPLGAAPAPLPAAPSPSLGQQTFLTRKLDTLATRIGAVGVSAAVAVFVVNGGRYVLDTLDGGAAAGLPLAQHVHHLLDLLINSITILVVAVPEGLPLAVTLALAFSVQRMLQDNNLELPPGARPAPTDQQEKK